MRHAAGVTDAEPVCQPWDRFREVVFKVKPTPRYRGACACGWRSFRTTSPGDALRWANDHVFTLAA